MRSSTQWQRVHFIQLSSLLTAGLDPALAIKTMIKDEPLLDFLQPTLASLRKGRALSLVLKEANIIDQYDCHLMHAAEQSGQLATFLKDYATTFSERISRQKQLKSRLIFPMLSFIVAITVQAILMQLRGVALGNIVVLSVFMLVAGWAGYRLLLNLVIENPIKGLDAVWTFSPISQRKAIIRLKEYYWLRLFHGLYKSGIDLASAMNVLMLLFSHPNYQQKMRLAATDIQLGAPLAKSLKKHGILSQADSVQLLTTGELSGSLEHSIERYLLIQREIIKQQSDAFLTWLARGIHLCVALFMINIIFIGA